MALADQIRLPIHNLIHRRSRLTQLLTDYVEGDHRLITVYAPSGYGKSIMLADFALTTDLPVCWCALEPANRDPTSFLTLLTYSISDRFHEIDHDNLRQVVDRGDTQASIRRIADVLDDVGDHIIIIDDYHKANSAGVTLALNRLLEQLPEATTVIVAARGDMGLDTAQILELLISEQATGLSEVELGFTGEEIQRVMRKRFGRRVDMKSAEVIASATHGNIAQVLLSGHMQSALSGQLLIDLRERLGDDRSIVYSYLADEVFEKQPPHLQRFMLHAAILPNMAPELCNALLDIDDAQACLEALVYEDLFITQIGAGFKFHDLFAEFLRNKLAEDQAEYHRITLKAAKLLAERGRISDAMNLYLFVEAWDEAADLLEPNWQSFYNTGRAMTLNDWLNQIPNDTLDGLPDLLSVQGRILLNDLNDPAKAIQIFERIEDLFFKRNDHIRVAETQIARANALRMMGQVNESLKLSHLGLEQLETLNADNEVMASAIRSRGLAHWTAGNIENALTDLRRALAIFEEFGDEYGVGLIHQEIGASLEKQGDLSGAYDHYKQAIGILEKLGNANDLANTLNSLGVCSLLKGNNDEGLKFFNESLDVATKIGATRRAAFAQAGIGDAFLANHKYDLAIEAYVTSTHLAHQANVRSLKLYNLVKQGEAYIANTDFSEALKLARKANDTAAETGLNFERGLACALLAKIHLKLGDYAASFNLFDISIDALAQNDVLEQAKVRLLYGYSLLLDLQGSKAFVQMREGITLALTLGEAIGSLRPTVLETLPLLRHFLYRTDTPAELRQSIWSLLRKSQALIDEVDVLPSLQLFTLGSPILIIAGKYKHFTHRGGIKQIPEFLLYLIIAGQHGGCPRDEVCDALWPDEDPNKVTKRFHQYIRRLRNQIFGDTNYIVRQDDYYQVNPDYLTWCDVLAFDTLYDRIAKLSPNEALDLQLELIDLYQGPLLMGFDMGTWGKTYRAAYETKFLQTVTLASEYLLAIGDPQEAIRIIDKGLAQDAFREDLHQNKLRALQRLGLYNDLDAYYYETCALFDREFGVSPDFTTEQLYENLVKQR